MFSTVEPYLHIFFRDFAKISSYFSLGYAISKEQLSVTLACFIGCAFPLLIKYLQQYLFFNNS